MEMLPRRRDGHVSQIPLTRSEIGQAIAALRSLRGMNQGALAAAAGIPGSAVSDYERGKTMPELFTLTLESLLSNHPAAPAPARPVDREQDGHESPETPRS